MSGQITASRMYLFITTQEHAALQTENCRCQKGSRTLEEKSRCPKEKVQGSHEGTPLKQKTNGVRM